MPRNSERVLFICKGNWFRSQMAAALYNNLTGTAAAESAGTYTGAPDEPEGQVLSNLFPRPDFFEFMERRGMNLRDQRTRRLRPEMLDRFDQLVCMAEEPFVPNFLRPIPRVIWWTVPNPRELDHEVVAEVFELVSRRVRELLTHADRSQ